MTEMRRLRKLAACKHSLRVRSIDQRSITEDHLQGHTFMRIYVSVEVRLQHYYTLRPLVISVTFLHALPSKLI